MRIVKEIDHETLQNIPVMNALAPKFTDAMASIATASQPGGVETFMVIDRTVTTVTIDRSAEAPTGKKRKSNRGGARVGAGRRSGPRAVETKPPQGGGAGAPLFADTPPGAGATNETDTPPAEEGGGQQPEGGSPEPAPASAAKPKRKRSPKKK